MGADRRVIVFARAPRPGQVKTRLVPPLTNEQAAAFHLALLDDVIALSARAGVAVPELRVGGGADDVAAMRRRYPDLDIGTQGPGDLGDRLRAAFADAFQGGAAAVVVVGSDHPTLPSEYLSSAFESLEGSEAVFGPSDDGGYYLVGLREAAWPAAEAIFRDVPWSTPEVLETGVQRALEARLIVGLLPEWYDVDRPEDLDRLAADAGAGSQAVRRLTEWGLITG